MKIVEINTCDYGSTGKIMLQIAELARKNNHTVVTFSRKWSAKKNNKNLAYNEYFGSFIENAIHHILGPLTGFSECFSLIGTISLITQLKKFKPDIIHLHNLHGWYINLPVLFKYIKKHNIKVIWTLHDCWSFTGHCPHFTLVKCDKWKTGCYDCPSYREYPDSFVDNAGYMYRLKKKWFTGIKNMTIVTPSQWLADLVKQSYLKDYPVKVIHNGIDLEIFKPTKSDFRKKYHIEDKHIVLGVAFVWGKRKGLDVFVELSKRLDERFQIVLVGTNDEVDRQLPSNIISIHKTSDQKELAEIYTAADLFVNPTREEVLGLVNVESLACGTPVITFNTGGSPECIDEKSGCVIDVDDVDTLEKEIVRICNNHTFQGEDCMKRANLFNGTIKYTDYTSLYV